MPQASDELRAEITSFFGADAEAFDAETYLRSIGYNINAGYITQGTAPKEEARKTTIAIDYLVQEWDYAFKEKP